MLYFVKNTSGNVSDVTEKMYNRLKDKDDYEAWTEDPYQNLPKEVEEIKGVPYKGQSSTDYTIAELKDIRDDFHDDQWEDFIEGDTRKSVPE